MVKDKSKSKPGEILTEEEANATYKTADGDKVVSEVVDKHQKLLVQVGHSILNAMVDFTNPNNTPENDDLSGIVATNIIALTHRFHKEVMEILKGDDSIDIVSLLKRVDEDYTNDYAFFPPMSEVKEKHVKSEWYNEDNETDRNLN